MNAIRAHVTCRCGKVKLAIDSPSALRFVCYCKDCRGYYNTLNRMSVNNSLPEAAKLDPFGGVDVTQVYPSEIKVLEGNHDLIGTVVIRKKSPYHRSFAKCCNTPLFAIGQGTGAALLNSALVSEDNQTNDVRYRIIGRQALKGDGSVKKPSKKIWIQKDKVHPQPVAESKDPSVLEGFTEG
eukprot:scaffold2953_cov190-Alexandrium_tamarense.AAC.12